MHPCKIDTINWWWNRKLQLFLFDQDINWGIREKIPLFTRQRRWLVITKSRNKHWIAWTTKSEWEALDLPAYTSKEILGCE